MNLLTHWERPSLDIGRGPGCEIVISLEVMRVIVEWLLLAPLPHFMEIEMVRTATYSCDCYESTSPLVARV